MKNENEVTKAIKGVRQFDERVAGMEIQLAGEKTAVEAAQGQVVSAAASGADHQEALQLASTHRYQAETLEASLADLRSRRGGLVGAVALARVADAETELGELRQQVRRLRERMEPHWRALSELLEIAVAVDDLPGSTYDGSTVGHVERDIRRLEAEIRDVRRDVAAAGRGLLAAAQQR